MKKFGISLIMACAVALCLALVGCGGGSQQDYSKNFVGNWEIVTITENGEETDQETLDMMRSMGLDVTLNMNEDKSFAMELMGDSFGGTWEAKSATEVDLTAEDEDGNKDTITATLDGEQLVLDLGDDMICTFGKADAAE